MANNRFIRNIKIEADASGNLPQTIQLLHVGSWNTPWHGDFEITEGDINEFAQNYLEGVGLPADNDGKVQINYGHHAGGEASGWLTNIRAEYVDSVYSLVGDPEWTPAAKQKLADGEYRYISPEFNPRALPWEDPEEEWRMVANVITGAALTNIPLFKKLKKVAASERPDSSKQRKEGEPMAFKLEEVRVLEASAINADQKAFLETHKSDLTAEEREKFGIEADAPATKVDGDAKTVAIDASELANLQAAAQQGVEAAQKLAQKEASDFASARIEAGQVKSDDKDKLVKILLASSAEARTELEDFLTGLPVNADISAGELGNGGQPLAANAHDELNTKVVAQINADVQAGKPRLAYSAVRASILAADADLAKRIKEEEDQ